MEEIRGRIEMEEKVREELQADNLAFLMCKHLQCIIHRVSFLL